MNPKQGFLPMELRGFSPATKIPLGFLSLGFMPLAAKLGLRATSNSSITQQDKILEKFMKTEAEAALACLVAG